MTDPADGLRALLDAPAAPPEPVQALHRRVQVRRSRRRRGRAALMALTAVAAGVVAVPLLDRPSDAPTRVVAGPDPVPTISSPPTTAALEFVPGQPLGSRLDVTVPPGWQTLLATGERIVLATRPLTDADRALAELARDDAAFSGAFPADGVVLVVGGDPVEAKYTTGPDGTTVAPGPAYGLGPERALPGGIRVRRGDVPQSGVKIAAYAGPSAPPARMAEAEAIATGVRLVSTGDPSVRPPPPPTGSRPGLPAGTLPVPETGLPEVARTPASGSALVLVAGQNCAYLRWAHAQISLPGYEPLGGACGVRPAGSGIESLGQPTLVRAGPGTAPSTVVILRVGAEVTELRARLADGRTVPASIGTDGWSVVAGDGRIVAVAGIDLQGRGLPETLVG